MTNDLNFIYNGDDHFNFMNKNDCNYHEIVGWKKNLKVEGNSFSLLNLNIRSLPKNFDQLSVFLGRLDHKFSVIILLETWLTDDNKDLYSIPGYSSHHIVRNNKNGGGVSLFVSDEFHFKFLPQFSKVSSHLESLFVRLELSKSTKPIFIGGIYRPPGFNDFNLFIDDLNQYFNSSDLKSKNIILGGDFNVNILNDSNSKCRDFLNNMYSNSFLPLINKPTRISLNQNNNCRSTLIDHIWTNMNEVFISGIIKSNISDHFPNFTSFNFKFEKNKPHYIKFRDFSVSNKDKFVKLVSEYKWDNFIKCEDVNINTNNFVKKFTEFYNISFPLRNNK